MLSPQQEVPRRIPSAPSNVCNLSAKRNPLEMQTQHFDSELVIWAPSVQHKPEFQTPGNKGVRHISHCLQKEGIVNHPLSVRKQWEKSKISFLRHQLRAKLTNKQAFLRIVVFSLLTYFCTDIIKCLQQSQHLFITLLYSQHCYREIPRQKFYFSCLNTCLEEGGSKPKFKKVENPEVMAKNMLHYLIFRKVTCQ